MALELRDVEISFISYVKKGANKKKFFLVKSEEKAIEKKVQIVKKEEAKRLVYGVVYEPNKEDAHGHLMTEEQIEKMAHRFMEQYQHIDKEHNQLAGAGSVIESWIAPSDMEINGEQIKKGSWVLVTKANEETWEKIKKKEYESYSMFGFAQDTKEIEKVEEGLVSKIVKGLVKTFSLDKDFDEKMENVDNNDIWRPFRVLEDDVWDILWDEEINKKDRILESIDQFREHVNAMKFNLTKSKEEEMKIETKEDLKKFLESDKGKELTKELEEENSEEIEEVEKIEEIEKETEDTKEAKKTKEAKETEKTEEAEKVVKGLLKGFESQLSVIKKDLETTNENIKRINKALLDSNIAPSDGKEKKTFKKAKMI